MERGYYMFGSFMLEKGVSPFRAILCSVQLLTLWDTRATTIWSQNISFGFANYMAFHFRFHAG